MINREIRKKLEYADGRIIWCWTACNSKASYKYILWTKIQLILIGKWGVMKNNRRDVSYAR